MSKCRPCCEKRSVVAAVLLCSKGSGVVVTNSAADVMVALGASVLGIREVGIVELLAAGADAGRGLRVEEGAGRVELLCDAGSGLRGDREIRLGRRGD
jgi:hypothetical protein